MIKLLMIAIFLKRKIGRWDNKQLVKVDFF